MEKRFYESKKFVYAMVTFVVSFVLAVLPSVLNLKPETVTALHEMLPFVALFGLSVIYGHTAMDALSLAKGAQVLSLQDAFAEVLEATPLGEKETA